MVLEHEIVSRLIKRENLIATRELQVGAGFIDIVTNDEIIEVKEASSWKHALGQVLAYKFSLGDKNKKMRIHLFSYDDKNVENMSEIVKICNFYDVNVTCEGGKFIRRYNKIDKTLEYLDKFAFAPTT